MAVKNEYSTNINVCVHPCAYSNQCNVKQSVWMNFTPFLLLLWNCSHVTPILYLCCNSFLHKNVLQAIHFLAKRGTRANINATTDHMEKLDVSEQWGLVAECGPERVHWWRMVRKQSNVVQDEAVCALGNIAVCRKTAVKPLFWDVLFSKKCS